MQFIPQFFARFGIRDIVDIALVAVFLFFLLLIIKGTRAVQIIQGIGVLLLLLLVSYYQKLETLYWLLHYLLISIAVALPIVFQPELRRALGYLGSSTVLGSTLPTLPRLDRESLTRIIDEISWATTVLSEMKAGALIVLEREMGLEDFIETGIVVNGNVSSKLLLSIFLPKSPLHDGAVIIRGEKVTAASCYLPLSENVTSRRGERRYGTRHRAAIGISETTDAIVVVVSEETGGISVARRGKLTKEINEESLKKVLNTFWPVTGAPQPAIRFPGKGGLDFLGFLKKKS
jgi:diadenylate cyclase